MTLTKSQTLIIQTIFIIVVCFIFLTFALEINASAPITKPSSDFKIYTETQNTSLEKPNSEVMISDPETSYSDDEEIQQIINEAKALMPTEATSLQEAYEPSLDDLASKYGITRQTDQEFSVGHALLAKIYNNYSFWEAELKKEKLYDPMIFFVTYDYGTTASLGAGERAGVMDSWIEAQELNEICIPRKAEDWENIIKIANGRWPNIMPENSYLKSKEDIFQQIYFRTPNYQNANDEAAMMIIAYGLRPNPRNMDSEKEALNFFKNIYQKDPINTSDWNIVRAIAYSGATR